MACDHCPGTSAVYVGLDELVWQSDVVTLHTPLTAETHHILNRQRIEHMRPGAFVVNTGRGSLIDTESLLRALESGRLGGAALDVLEARKGCSTSTTVRAPERIPSWRGSTSCPMS